MNWDEDESYPGNYTGNVLRIGNGNPPELFYVSVEYTQGVNTDSKLLSDIESSNLQVGSMTLNFYDNDADGKLGPEDTFILSGVYDSDVIKLIYEITSGEMYSSSFW